MSDTNLVIDALKEYHKVAATTWIKMGASLGVSKEFLWNVARDRRRLTDARILACTDMELRCFLAAARANEYQEIIDALRNSMVWDFKACKESAV